MKKIGEGIFDRRINSWNFLFELSLNEYFELVKDIMTKNEFQRNRVASSKTIYALLKDDLREGCLIPPIVLALYDNLEAPNKAEEELQKKKDKLVLLDGLQRTYTIRDLVNDLEKEDKDKASEILNNTIIRIEVYWGISRTNVLYRMLTLNTGHTPMTARHQIEIVYADLIESPIDGIEIIKETDSESIKGVGMYSFKDVIDGFTSYLEGDFLPIDRTDILSTVKGLDSFIEKNKGERQRDLFTSFITSYNNLVKKIDELSNHWDFEDYAEEFQIINPFGKNIYHLFSKVQSLAGYGSAIYKLMNANDIESFDEVNSIIANMDANQIIDGLNKLNILMNEIKETSKKIGNDQRFFFNLLYRRLFSPEKDTQGKLYNSIEEAYQSFERNR